VNLPPKICIPNREKMKMNRNKITSREFMDEMEFTRDFTKLPIDAQYLKMHVMSICMMSKLTLKEQLLWTSCGGGSIS
jgi:hypothetical protein